MHEIVAMRQGGTKLADIASFLTTSNVPTRRGGGWSAEQVRSIFERSKTHDLPQLRRRPRTRQPAQILLRKNRLYRDEHEP
ncbi:MAG TPA: recombinase family protein [Thermoanaerobaculia bacterium]